MKLRKNKKGFTIVELVIVIGVIGILSAILIPTFVNLTDNANRAALKSNLANAYSMYAADAADGHVGEDGDKLEFRGQENVALSETKLDAGTGKSAFLYTVADGWGTDKTSGLEVVASLTTEAQTDKYLLTADEMYGGYYVYYKLLATDKA